MACGIQFVENFWAEGQASFCLAKQRLLKKTCVPLLVPPVGTLATIQSGH